MICNMCASHSVIHPGAHSKRSKRDRVLRAGSRSFDLGYSTTDRVHSFQL
jgi:hypothetical protein